MERAYLDTNIFDYVALEDPKYGTACKNILLDIDSHFSATCSFQVPVEMLGSLSALNPTVAIGAVNAFMSLNIKVVPVSNEILLEAIKIISETGLEGYDAIHAATMKTERINTIITENYKDFKKVKWLRIIRPLDYSSKF